MEADERLGMSSQSPQEDNGTCIQNDDDESFSQDDADPLNGDNEETPNKPENSDSELCSSEDSTGSQQSEFSSPIVKKIVDGLGWSGQVKLMMSSAKADAADSASFAFCHHCQVLTVGTRHKVKKHIVSHYAAEILREFPESSMAGGDCCICHKEYREPADLALHYGIGHKVADRVVPEEHLQIGFLSSSSEGGCYGKPDGGKKRKKSSVGRKGAGEALETDCDQLEGRGGEGPCSSDLNQEKRKFEDLEDEEEKKTKKRKISHVGKLKKEKSEAFVKQEQSEFEISGEAEAIIKLEPLETELFESAAYQYTQVKIRNKPAKHCKTDTRTSAEEIDALVQKLGWTGDVKQVCLSKHARQSFAVCHHCHKLIVGASDSIRRHIITHYNNEILKLFPVGKDCSICGKVCRGRAELALHYAIAHGMAKEVIPPEHLFIKNVPEFLKFENYPVVDVLIERLGWSGEVKQYNFGAQSNVFIVCQHCPKLCVGHLQQVRAHIISHYASEIMKNFPNKDECSICEKKLSTSYSSELAYHYAMKHGLAYKVVPEKDLQFTLISEVLQGDSELKLLEDEQSKARALKNERRKKAKAEKREKNVTHDSDVASSDDENDFPEKDFNSIDSNTAVKDPTCFLPNLT